MDTLTQFTVKNWQRMNSLVALKITLVSKFLIIYHLNDRYRVRKIIGRGGNSTIVKARDLMLGRSVALKILKDQYKRR